MTSVTSSSIEHRRIEIQQRLDLLKSPLERNKWGQFATPPDLSFSLAHYARTLLASQPVRFLDPAVGTGSFFSALSEAFPREQIHSAAGIELDPLFSDAAQELWKGMGLRVIQGDFFREVPSEKFSLILSNPPYVRHHHISSADKERLKSQVAQSVKIDVSGLAGLYCYFLLLSHDWMEENGLAVWLIPSEFMDVNYGSALRRYLTEQVTLLHIHRFCPEDVQFADALVSSAVVVFRNSKPMLRHSVRFSFGGSIEAPETESEVSLDVLMLSGKWTQFPGDSAHRVAGEVTLGDIFQVKRGLATGCNEYFILSRDETEKWEIPASFLKPILPGPRYLRGDIVEDADDGMPGVSPQLYLLDCDLDEKTIQDQWPRFYEYLQVGKAQDANKSYIASRRTPWYSQEVRAAAPFLCTYMGRSRNGENPFRFIWNRSHATAHNVYLLLYPKGQLKEALRSRPELHSVVFEGLKGITSAQFASEGRVYGGGLRKVEPKELARISATSLLELINLPVQISTQIPLFV